MITVPPDADFELADADWEQIATAAGVEIADVSKRYTLEHVIEGWLRDAPPGDIRDRREKTSKVVEAARSLLATIEETGQDWRLSDDQMLSDVAMEVVASWDDFTWVLKNEGGYQGRGPLQYELCGLWKAEWDLPLAASIDPATGVAGGPLVRFLMAVHQIVVGEELRPHQARYAVRRMDKRFADPAPLTEEERAAWAKEGEEVLDDLIASANGERRH